MPAVELHCTQITAKAAITAAHSISHAVERYAQLLHTSRYSCLLLCGCTRSST